MIPEIDLDTAALSPCASIRTPDSADLVWMLRRAEAPLTEVFDRACREVGLRDVRDTLVLGVADDGDGHTQTELAQIVGLDKSTLGAIIDRLEREGLIERGAHGTNRKVRIPLTTDAGRRLLEQANARGRAAVDELLSAIPGSEIAQLRPVLWKLANLPTG